MEAHQLEPRPPPAGRRDGGRPRAETPLSRFRLREWVVPTDRGAIGSLGQSGPETRTLRRPLDLGGDSKEARHGSETPRRRTAAALAGAGAHRRDGSLSSQQAGRDTRGNLPATRGHAQCAAGSHGRAAPGELGADGRERDVANAQFGFDGRAGPANAAGTAPAPLRC